jgi:hypothetical protein
MAWVSVRLNQGFLLSSQLDFEDLVEKRVEIIREKLQRDFD